ERLGGIRVLEGGVGTEEVRGGHQAGRLVSEPHAHRGIDDVVADLGVLGGPTGSAPRTRPGPAVPVTVLWTTTGALAFSTRIPCPKAPPSAWMSRMRLRRMTTPLGMGPSRLPPTEMPVPAL